MNVGCPPYVAKIAVNASGFRAHLPWVVLVSMGLGVAALSARALRPPAPPPGEVPSDGFSEQRARRIVRHLSQDIGVRLNGTSAHRRAAEYLAAELGKIPGVEVEIQDAGGTHIHKTVELPAFVYRTLNVVGRLPGRSTEAVLLNAHFDTYLDSVGAADDAAGVAAIVEAVRALAREAPLERTLIVNLNGAEELGLLGAAGFLAHRWAKDIRAYIYLEAFPGGKVALLDAGPDDPSLAKVYARAVDKPLGSIVGHDLLRTGLLPHNGDFTPLHEAGLRGFDMAMTGDGWAYHTMLDTPDRLEPGALQYMGDAVVALTRALANEPLPTSEPGDTGVFYSVLGTAMLAYSTTTARGLAIAALAFAIATIAWAFRRGLIAWSDFLRGFGWTLLGISGGLLAAVASAVFVALVLRRPPGWLASPVLILPAFGGCAFAGMVAVHALWCRRARPRRDRRTQVCLALAGGLAFWSILLASSAIAGVGSGYVALFWVTCGSLALLACTRSRLIRPHLTMVLFLPALVVTIELPVGFASYFVPMRGMLSASSVDVVVAAVVGIGVVASAITTLPLVHGLGSLGRAAVISLGVGVLGLTLVSLKFPYSETRPKRVDLSHVETDGRSAVLVSGRDVFGMEEIWRRLRGAEKPEPGQWPGFQTNPQRSAVVPAPPPPMPAPRMEVVDEKTNASPSGRRVTLRIHATSPVLRLSIPQSSLTAWSLGPLAATPPIGGRYRALFYNLGPEGHDVTLELQGQEAAEIELRATDGARADSPQVRAILQALPKWTTATAVSHRVVRQKI